MSAIKGKVKRQLSEIKLAVLHHLIILKKQFKLNNTCNKLLVFNKAAPFVNKATGVHYKTISEMGFKNHMQHATPYFCVFDVC